ncbi:MAG: TIGR04255 family protein [Xanthomonadales bacterium]|nr:TIGR04255 family protein [Xanthomonadales bacterium]MBK7146417.1 TIGR04255 family protein [Xanthomonadales bacterium]
MNSLRLPLEHPPIVEAVVDIVCAMRPDFDLEATEAAARDALRSNYPKMQQRKILRYQVTDLGGASPSHSKAEGLEALVFRSDDERQMVQFRNAGYSFNRLAPYTGLDDYLPEIERTWRLFESIVRPVSIKAVKLRYINRIPLPLTDGNVELEHYLAFGPQSPDGSALASFLVKTLAIDHATKARFTTTLAAQEPYGETLPVVLDIEAEADLGPDEHEWSSIASHIAILRGVKNRVFDENLKPSCQTLFQ